jgi:hypothetical protein
LFGSNRAGEKDSWGIEVKIHAVIRVLTHLGNTQQIKLSVAIKAIADA